MEIRPNFQPAAAFLTPATICCGVSFGPESNSRFSVSPETRILTCVPPISIVRTGMEEALMRGACLNRIGPEATPKRVTGLRSRFHGKMNGRTMAREISASESQPTPPIPPEASVLLATLVSFSGGFLDAFTYVGHGRVFANAMTGNVVLLG